MAANASGFTDNKTMKTVLFPINPAWYLKRGEKEIKYASQFMTDSRLRIQDKWANSFIFYFISLVLLLTYQQANHVLRITFEETISIFLGKPAKLTI